MRSVIYIILLSFMVSCASSQRITIIKYKREKVGELSKSITYSMAVPKGYKLITLVEEHGELEKQYVYSDSTKIYISDFGNSMLSYDNILSLGDSVANKRFEELELKAKIAKEFGEKYTPETIVLQGKTSSGLYWKDIRLGYLSIGYVNVLENRMMQFDKALNSFIEK